MADYVPKDTTIPRANTEHPCVYCPRHITKGEEYLSERFNLPPGQRRRRMHRGCIPASHPVNVLLKTHDWDWLRDTLKKQNRIESL